MGDDLVRWIGNTPCSRDHLPDVLTEVEAYSQDLAGCYRRQKPGLILADHSPGQSRWRLDTVSLGNDRYLAGFSPVFDAAQLHSALLPRINPYEMESRSASHDASTTFTPTPTLPQLSRPSEVSISTLVLAAVPLSSSRMRTR